MNYKKYQKIKAMQSFKQKFSEMTKEYRDGFKSKRITTLNDNQSVLCDIIRKN